MIEPHLYDTLIWCLPLIVLCLLISVLNLPKHKRHQQVLMPILAVVYGIIAVSTEGSFRTKLLENADVWINLFDTFGYSLESLCTYVMNALYILGFMAVKMIVLVLCWIFWSDDVTRVTSIKYYQRRATVRDIGVKEDTQNRASNWAWILRPEYRQSKYYFYGFYIALLGASAIIFILSQYYPQNPVFLAAFYPFLGVLILGEIYAFLNGPDEIKILESKASEIEKPAEGISELDKIRGILRDLFKKRDLQDGLIEPLKGNAETFDWHSAVDAMPNKHVSEIAHEYFTYLEKEATRESSSLDMNYIQSSVHLLEGKSVLICNPFYQDLTDYMMLPIMRVLMKHHRCLIVPGRESSVEDICTWMQEASAAFVGTSGVWRVDTLKDHPEDLDIGILRPSDIYDLKLLQANADFFSRVGFVLLVEPSHVLATGQMGMRLIIHQMMDNRVKDMRESVVYCACDRNSDGLVDVLSHTLRTNLTEVTATVSTRAFCSQMCWRAEGAPVHHILWPGIARYLDLGTPLAAVAMQNAVDTVTWISSSKFPVIDMKWFAGQYYSQICQFVGMAVSQVEFQRRFDVQANLWKGGICADRFLIVEDEFYNLFEMHRLYAARASGQSFVNVISENYMLRDYMVANLATFIHDPKAIPTIVPDFARTERNTVIKLLMLMASAPLKESQIEQELTLCGIRTEGAVLHKLQKLVNRHCHVDASCLEIVEGIDSDGMARYGIQTENAQRENGQILDYLQNLKTARILTEDEYGNRHLLGAVLYGHVYQAYLPGQYAVYEGKYYEIRAITKENGVLLRRAADHIHRRQAYRQVRSLTLSDWQDESQMGARTTYAGMTFQRGTASVEVRTDGYLEQADLHDFKTAYFVSVSNIPTRKYSHKTVLRITLPKISEKQRLTLCFVLNEIFRTLYPDSHAYIYAVTELSQKLMAQISGSLKHLLYRFVIQDALEHAIDEDLWQTEDSHLTRERESSDIYIIEDSEIDLGLLVSVERYIRRYFEIALDYLMWHAELQNDGDARVWGDDLEVEDAPKTVTSRIGAFFKRLFRMGHQKTFETPRSMSRLRPEPVVEWLKLGDDKTPDFLDIHGLITYMQSYGLDNNALTKARQYLSHLLSLSIKFASDLKGFIHCLRAENAKPSQLSRLSEKSSDLVLEVRRGVLGYSRSAYYQHMKAAHQHVIEIRKMLQQLQRMQKDGKWGDVDFSLYILKCDALENTFEELTRYQL